MKPWLAAMRPRTWPASLVPVGVGIAVASAHSEPDVLIAALTVASALSLQIATNLANDYWDAVRGIDRGERLGPTRATQSGSIGASAVKRAVWIAIAMAAIAGVPLVLRGGALIVTIGIVSLVAALAYSAGPFPLASAGLGELLAFVFFGLVAVVGTTYLQLGGIPRSAVLSGAAVGCYAAAIMLVNNLRDIPTDGPAGKRTLAVRIGEIHARRLYAALLAGAFVFTGGVALSEASAWPLLVLSVVPAAVRASCAVAVRRGRELNQSLAATARQELFFGACLAAGLVLA